jgi:hypothetical protein
MKRSTALLRACLAFAAFSVIQSCTFMLIAALKAAPPAHTLPWLLLSNALVVSVLCIVALRSDWRGWRLGTSVAAIPTVIACVNAIEGTFFLKNSGIDWPRLFASIIVSAILAIPVWTLLFGMRPAASRDCFHPIASKSGVERAWKFVLSDLTYALLYLVAGAIIFPYVKDFYATQQLPSLSTILKLQLLVRGPIFVVVCLVLVRMLGLPRPSGAFAVGAIFAVLNGVAPLLIPNPVFPDTVRWVHMCEVTSSNFLFGTIVGWLWGRPGLAPSAGLRSAA